MKWRVFCCCANQCYCSILNVWQKEILEKFSLLVLFHHKLCPHCKNLSDLCLNLETERESEYFSAIFSAEFSNPALWLSSRVLLVKFPRIRQYGVSQRQHKTGFITIQLLIWIACLLTLTCCNLLNLWISSMNITVSLLNIASSFLATFTASFTSFIPDVVADNFTTLFCWLFLQWDVIMLTKLVWKIIYSLI